MANKNFSPIGIFDSGIGGLSVLKDATKVLPHEDFIYFCDQKNIPYGNKSPRDLKNYIREGVDFLIEKGAKAIVMACNTATSIAIEDLREDFPNIPLIGMEPAIKPALMDNEGGKIVVLATPVTLEQEKFSRLREELDKDEELVVLPAEKLASMIDEFLVSNPGQYSHSEDIERYLDDIFGRLDIDDISTVVLGCTHYLFIKEYLEKVLPDRVRIIDGNEGTVNHLKKILTDKGLLNDEKEDGSIRFYSSGEGLIDVDRVFRDIMKNYLE